MPALLRFLWFPTLVLAIMLAWLRLDVVLGWHGWHLPRAGWVLIAAGSAVACWCAAIFHSHGRGTPNPFAAKTKHLVDIGPYGVVRNPMIYAIGVLLAGVALVLGSACLWFGIAMFAVFWGIFVPLYEERDMERRFGQEYRDYCARVPRWVPRRGGRQALSPARKPPESVTRKTPGKTSQAM